MTGTVDPELMLRAYHTVGSSDIAPITSVIGKKFEVVNDDGTKTMYEVTDNPISQLVDAVRTVFPGMTEGACATLRLYQLFAAINLHSDDLSPLVQIEGDEIRIHTSLIQAAATAKMTADDTFDPGTLLIESTRYFAPENAA